MTTARTDLSEVLVFAEQFDAICANVGKVVKGKAETIRLAVTCLLAGGHLLLEDVPGVGKTALAKSLAKSVEGDFGRIQFTPDLLPADVLGTSVWDQRSGTFEFRSGPIFSNLLLADEINRASPKTQSALLEAMAEQHATIDGSTHPLPRPFMVIATQNPIEHHGTFPLPESQLDRFEMKLTIGYPGPVDEISLIQDKRHQESIDDLRPVVHSQDVLALIAAARRVHVSDALAVYAVSLANASRQTRQLSIGVSPRALLGLIRASQVHAASQGREFVTPDDLKRLAVPVLAHRVLVSIGDRMQGIDGETAIGRLVEQTPITG